MNKGIGFLVIAGVMVVAGCSEQKQAAAPATPAMQEQAQAVAEQVQGVADQAKVTADQAMQADDQAKGDAQEVAKNISGQVQDLLAKAKAFVDSGKFDEAIAQAQQILTIDPNNMDAKNIIETAKAKMVEMAKNQAADLTNKLGAFGK